MVDYTIVRTRRRTMALQVKRDLSVVVRAPMRTPAPVADRFVRANEAWITRQQERARQLNAAYPEPTEQELERLRQLAQDVIPARVEVYAGRMGLFPTRVRIGAARARYGSCSAKNSLNFSCLLMRFPPEEVDFVVVHELAHIAHKNHGAAFYALVESILPDWRQRRAMLTEDLK